MGRTERQRKVIQMIVYKSKHAGLSKIFNIMDDVFPMVTTSLGKEDILQLLPTLIGYSIDETAGFPSSYKFSNVKGSIIVPTDLVSNVQELHKFLYGDANYTPSATVTANSEKILEIVGGAGNLDDVQKNIGEENTENDSVIFEKNGSGWTDTSGSGEQYDPDNSGDTSGGEDNTYVPDDNTGGNDDIDDGTDGDDVYVPDDTTGGDTTGGDTTGGDTTGGDTTGGDTTGGDTSGGDMSGGDTGSGGDGGDIDAGGDASDAIEASEQGAPGEADAA